MKEVKFSITIEPINKSYNNCMIKIYKNNKKVYFNQISSMAFNTSEDVFKTIVNSYFI